MDSIKRPYYQTIHPNPIGLLYEKCKDMGAQRPRDRSLFSGIEGEHIVEITALSVTKSGSATRKQDAKAIAALKVLVELGHLVVPEGSELSDQKENITSQEANSSSFHEFTRTTAPEFNKKNPILSVNWILWNASKDLAEVFYESIVEGKTKGWMATCMTSNEKFETSAVGSTKREAEVAAVEGMYHTLLADPDIRDKLRVFQASMERTTFLPTKTSKDYPSDWSKMRHPMFLSGGGKNDESLDGKARETDTEMLNELKDPTARLNHLAERNGFTFNFAEWPSSKFLQLQRCFMASSLNGHDKGDVSVDKSNAFRVMLSLSFDEFQKQPLIFAGHGRTIEIAKENAVRNALRYFNIMERAKFAENNDC